MGTNIAVLLFEDAEELGVEEGTSQVRAAALGEVVNGTGIDHLFLTSAERVPEVERRLSRRVRCFELPRPSIETISKTERENWTST